MERFGQIISFLILAIGQFHQAGTSSGALANSPTPPAHLWSGLLTTNRAIDWNNAGATIPSLPANCATQPAAQTANALNTAIAANVGGTLCTIDLSGWGSVSMDHTISINFAGKANVVLNGAGPQTTKLVFTALTSNCDGLQPTGLCVTNGSGNANVGAFNWPNSVTVSSGMSKGSTTVVLPSHTNLQVGSQIQFGQADPGSDTGNIWFCASTGSNGTCSQQGSQSSPKLSGVSYSQTQMVTVTGCGVSTYGTACTSNTITISPGIYAPNWGTTTAWWDNSLPIQTAGVQNLTIDLSSIGSGTTPIIVECHACTNDWFSRLTTIANNQKQHYFIENSNHVTIQQSYEFGSVASSGSYGVDLAWGTSDSLVVDNISQKVAAGIVTETAVGNVFAYNLQIDNNYVAGWQACDTDLHAAGDYYNLFEGNSGSCFNPDNIHGTSNFNTVFRSYYSGFDPAAYARNGNSNPSRMVANQQLATTRYYNFVASVWGTSGKETTYEYKIPNSTSCGTINGGQVFQLGPSNQNNTAFSVACGTGGFDIPNDTLTYTTLMRWGNYDDVTAAVRTCTGSSGAPCTADETASTDPSYPGLASPSTSWSSFPSFIYSSKPSWFKTIPWPAIGPEVTGGNIVGTGGHANLIPAADCYYNQMGGSNNGSSGLLTFNPSLCY